MNQNASPLEWQPLWDAMDSRPDEWIETTSSMWWDMLECVPPRAQAGGRFLVGEPKRHDENGKAVHACFWKRADGRCFAQHMTVDEFRRLA